MTERWNYRPDLDLPRQDLIGYDVEATDGRIGTIDEAGLELGDSYLVVDTGFWIFGKRRVIPARAVRQIDVEHERVFVDLTKDQVKGAPDYDAAWREADAAREPFSAYYGPFMG